MRFAFAMLAGVLGLFSQSFALSAAADQGKDMYVHAFAAPVTGETAAAAELSAGF